MRKLTASVIFLSLLFLSSSFTDNITKGKESINWISIEEAEKLMAENPKKILIDVYTTWCGPCREMANTTFKDERVVEIINEHYYAVKVNAEGLEDITFRGHTFKNNGKVHDFVKQFGVTAYPTILYLDTDKELISAVPGFWKAKDFEVILSFFEGNHYKTTAFDSYKDNYKRKQI